LLDCTEDISIAAAEIGETELPIHPAGLYLTQNQKEKGNAKKCALDVPRIRSAHRPYLKMVLAMLWDCENYCTFEQNRAFCSGLKIGSSYGREDCRTY
jgi:hypothetical protein